MQFVYGTDAHAGRHGTTRRRRRRQVVVPVVVLAVREAVVVVLAAVVLSLESMLVLQLSWLNPHGEKAES